MTWPAGLLPLPSVGRYGPVPPTVRMLPGSAPGCAVGAGTTLARPTAPGAGPTGEQNGEQNQVAA
jgi:hypothetical protein